MGISKTSVYVLSRCLRALCMSEGVIPALHVFPVPFPSLGCLLEEFVTVDV
jgi:hypothetical protein